MHCDLRFKTGRTKRLAINKLLYKEKTMGGEILQSFNINELAGAAGLVLGALGALLAVIFKSRCHCKLNMCYLCQCERKPPPEKEVDSSEEEIIPPGQDQPVIDRSAPPPTTSP